MSDIIAIHNGRKYKVFSKIGKLPKDLKRKDIKKFDQKGTDLIWLKKGLSMLVELKGVLK